MATKVKGLLRGLRYISQMFEEEKEPEMQIGFPTDVKHVAHIGWEGPSATTPSWMNEFKLSEDSNAVVKPVKEAKDLSVQLPMEDTSQGEKIKRRTRRSSGGSAGSPLGSPRKRTSEAPRQSRRAPSAGTSSPLDSPRAPKPSRHNRSSNTSIDSPSRESSGSSRTSRRQQNSGLTMESPTNGQPSVPKHSRGRKSKGSGGSSKSSKSKEKNTVGDSFPFTGHESGGSQTGNLPEVGVGTV